MRTVLYHANCYDGFCAAWLIHKHHWPDADFHPINYSDPVPWEKIDGADVIIADFSFKRPVMLEIRKRALTLVVLDHHKTAQAELKGLDFCTFDMAKSGGRLTWEWISEQRDWPDGFLDVPRLVEFTEDRDLWRWAIQDSQEINMGIRSYPMDFKTWDYLEEHLKRGVLRQEGAAILRFQGQYIDAARNFIRRVEVDLKGDGEQHEVPFVNAPYFSISDLLNALCEDEQKAGRLPMAIAWFQRKDRKYQYSLRSIGEVDVSEFARRHGGGGHKNAAGFESDVLLWP